jgi:hypothetical protein
MYGLFCSLSFLSWSLFTISCFLFYFVSAFQKGPDFSIGSLPASNFFRFSFVSRHCSRLSRSLQVFDAKTSETNTFCAPKRKKVASVSLCLASNWQWTAHPLVLPLTDS